MGILLNGYLYRNNSIITFENIGEGSNCLFCFTNLTSCCRGADTGMGALGNWYFPNESAVDIERVNIYKNRGPSVVRLHKKPSITSPTGIYHCDIPDNASVSQSIFVGVYPMEKGENETCVQIHS